MVETNINSNLVEQQVQKLNNIVIPLVDLSKEEGV